MTADEAAETALSDPGRVAIPEDRRPAETCGNSGENRWKGLPFRPFPLSPLLAKRLEEDPLAKEELLEFEGTVEELCPTRPSA